MEKRLKEIAEVVGGEIIGNECLIITGVSGIEDAEKGDITFLANPRYLQQIYSTKASAVIASSELKDITIPVLKVKSPYLALSKILSFFSPPPSRKKGIHQNAVISPIASIGKDVSIQPNVYIGDKACIGNRVTLFPGVFIGDGAEVGDDSLIYSNVSIREGCKIGERVIIHCNSVIGSDGFGFVKEDNRHTKIPQVGIVNVEDDVEIGACVTIDRATIGETIIREGTKIDNLVQIAHNVEIGRDSIIVAQVGISGSTKIGQRATLAGQVGVVGHLNIGEDVMVGAQSGVTKDLPSGKIFSGSPCIPHGDWLKAQTIFKRLPEIKKQIGGLKKKLKEIEMVVEGRKPE
ncbi:MAG: UDP-3-O-(3-hydroxymyristoyl)glucosamine N-acyltransferase [Thermodesulfobacteriota bacterium]